MHTLFSASHVRPAQVCLRPLSSASRARPPALGGAHARQRSVRHARESRYFQHKDSHPTSGHTTKVWGRKAAYTFPGLAIFPSGSGGGSDDRLSERAFRALVASAFEKRLEGSQRACYTLASLERRRRGISREAGGAIVQHAIHAHYVSDDAEHVGDVSLGSGAKGKVGF